MHKLRDPVSHKRNGCAILTFGSAEAAERALRRDGTEIVPGTTIAVRRSKRRRAPPGHEDDGGGARFDALHNKLYAPEPPEADTQRSAAR